MNNYSSANLTLINQKSKEETQYILSCQEINILGRSPDCQIVLNPQEYVTVSRHHAEIKLVEKEEELFWEINDKGTTNGTLINGEKITSSYQLKSGDRILLGLKGPEFIFTTETLNPTILVDDLEEESQDNQEEKLEEKEEKIKEDIPQEVKTKKEDIKEKKIERKTPERKSVKDKIEKTEDKVKSKETVEKKEEVVREKINIESYLTPIITPEKNLFNLVTFKEIITLDIDSKEVNCCAFNPDNQLVAMALTNKSIEIWEWQKKNKITTIDNAHKMAINSINFSHDSKKIVSSGSDKIVKIWDIETQTEIASLSGHKMAVNSLAFSEDGKILASSGSDKIIKIWDIEKQEEIASLAGHKMAVNSLYFSSDNKYLISGGGDKVIKLWNIETKEEEKAIKVESKSGIQSLIYSSDNQLISCLLQDGKISIFHREKEIEIISLNIPREWGELINMNQEGSLLISKSEKGIMIGEI